MRREMSAHRSQAQDAGSRPRVLIADDDPVVRAMLAVSLERDFELVGAAADALEAIQLAADTLPDGALIDVEMPEGGGPAAVRGIMKVSPTTAMVALSANDAHDAVLKMLEAGAMGYRRKGEPRDLLIETLHRSIRSHSA
jgi:two-component system, NarL family, response regulator DesR